MKGDRVPDAHHVSRFCKPSTVDNGEVQATAFMLRANEPYLSVNWLECLDCGSREEEIEAISGVYRRIFSSIRPNARIAVLNVGGTRKRVARYSDDSRDLWFVHEPTEPDDMTHSGIYNLREDDEVIAELIAQSVQQVHRVA
jgi:hypothetical protein